MTERKIPFNQLGKAGYNRGINRNHVNRIKRDFRDDMVQPAIVSFRDGRHWIIDHQHQTQAIYELNGSDPNTPILCDVRTGLTYEQEADLYYRLNTGSKKLTFTETMVGLIEAKDPTALRFRGVIEGCGYVIGGNSCNSLRAVKTAWNIFKEEGGEETLARILTLAHDCWPENNGGADCRMIDGIAMFLRCHGDYRRKTFVDKMSHLNPNDIIRKAITYYKQMDSKSFTQPYCTYSMLVTEYNSGLKTNRLAPVSAPGI